MKQNLKYEYRDNRGLLIDPDLIISQLDIINKSESEVAEFLGEERMSRNGQASSFLQMFSTQERWYVERCHKLDNRYDLGEINGFGLAQDKEIDIAKQQLT